MFRILILFLIIYLIYRFFKTFFSKKPDEQYNVKKEHRERLKGEKVIKCNNCNVYVPESTGTYFKDKFFCSDKCLEEYKSNE
jgi:formylmethanofuran dehydrogenase subunit E